SEAPGLPSRRAKSEGGVASCTGRPKETNQARQKGTGETDKQAWFLQDHRKSEAYPRQLQRLALLDCLQKHKLPFYQRCLVKPTKQIGCTPSLVRRYRKKFRVITPLGRAQLKSLDDYLEYGPVTPSHSAIPPCLPEPYPKSVCLRLDRLINCRRELQQTSINENMIDQLHVPAGNLDAVLEAYDQLTRLLLLSRPLDHSAMVTGASTTMTRVRREESRELEDRQLLDSLGK
ncbi:unnamed protein product, partial [Protopolystoma xenopodis]